MKNKNKKIIGLKQIKKAYQTLLSYKEGKRALETRIVENEEWYKLRCGYSADGSSGQNSAWIFNSIINKHADAMDCYPEPNVLAREKGDENLAKKFSAILPVIL